MRQFFYILLTLLAGFLRAQEVNLTLDKNDISLHEKLVLSIDFSTALKREFKAYQSYFFPDIPDFVKEQTTFGETDKGFRISQYYRPLQTGAFSLNSFSIRVKGQQYSFKGAVVRVKDGKINIRNPSSHQTFTFAEPDAFLDLKTTRRNVHLGAGVGISVALMIAEDNEAEITLKEMTFQRHKILQLLKMQNCMAEENLDLAVRMDTITYKGKRYNRWNFAEMVVFPLDSNQFVIPSVSLEVIAYELARSESGIERRPVKRFFKTSPVKIKILSTSGVGQVGNFKLSETISTTKFKTGKSFTYNFIVVGEGNISALADPLIISNEVLDIYPPKISKEVFFKDGTMIGAKSYTYFITPKEPGNFMLGDFIRFPYFSTELNRPDTLYSKITMKIKGESLKNTYISTNHPDDFYSSALTGSNQLEPLQKKDSLAMYTNILILLMLVISGVIVLKK